MKKFLLLPILFSLLLFISCNESDNSGKEFLWLKQWGSSGTDIGNSMVLDNSGNIYVTGYTDGNLDKNTNNGETDIFLTKLNPKGEKQWTKQWGTLYWDETKSSAIDNKGNIYITGSITSDNIDDNSEEEEYNSDSFLTKINTAGEIQWTKQWGTINNEKGNSIAIDDNGNIYVTGYTGGDLEENTNKGSGDIFLTKFNTDGEIQWTKLWGTPNKEEATSIVIDNNGNIYLTGYTEGNLNGNTNQGSRDVFLIKLNQKGEIQWTKLWGTSQIETANAIATDSEDNLYITGFTEGDLDQNANSGFLDIFLTKFNTDGEKQWTKQWGTNQDDWAYSLAINGKDDIYVTGFTYGSLDKNTSLGFLDIFLTKFNANGEKQWTKQWGTSNIDTGNYIAIDDNDDIYIIGSTGGNFAGNENKGDVDIFLIKFKE